MPRHISRLIVALLQLCEGKELLWYWNCSQEKLVCVLRFGSLLLDECVAWDGIDCFVESVGLLVSAKRCPRYRLLWSDQRRSPPALALLLSLSPSLFWVIHQLYPWQICGLCSDCWLGRVSVESRRIAKDCGRLRALSKQSRQACCSLWDVLFGNLFRQNKKNETYKVKFFTWSSVQPSLHVGPSTLLPRKVGFLRFGVYSSAKFLHVESHARVGLDP